MMQKTLLALALAGSVLATGCGGGGGSSAPSGPTAEPAARNDVAGPLDVVQVPISEQVLAPLSAAVAGTPLTTVVDCVDQAVVNDVIDVVDALALGLQAGAADPATALAAVAGDLQSEIGDLVADLQGLVLSLAGGGAGCNSSTSPFAGTNPLAGTPLADFGSTLLPVLAQLQQALDGNGTVPAAPLSLAQLETVLEMLTSSFDSAFAQLPAEVTGAPVVGPVLAVVQQTLVDLESVITSAASGTPDPAVITAGITTTLENLLTGMLTGVVPVQFLEGGSLPDGAISGDIAGAVASLTSVLTDGLGGGDPTALVSDLTDAISGLLDPLTGGALAGGDLGGGLFEDLLGTLLGSLDGVTGGTLPGGATGTPLDSVLAALTDALSGTAGETLLGDLLGAIDGLLGGLFGSLDG